MNKSLAILLTVYNRKECTLKCLQQLSTQHLNNDNLSIGIYIVDGGSSDGTVTAVRNKFHDVNIMVKDGVFWNRGMYAAWMWASSEKKYDYYLWLNDDTFLYPDCLSTLLVESAYHADNAIIVGATLDTKTKSKQTYGGRLVNDRFPPLGVATEVNHFNGNIVLVPSPVYEKLGNLDPYYTHSKGDYDYGVRARRAGIKMIQAAHALGECDVHPRIDKWCDPSIPLAQRWRLMKRPNGMPPNESFHLNRKTSLISAVWVYVSIHIQCLFPWIWVILRKRKIVNI